MIDRRGKMQVVKKTKATNKFLPRFTSHFSFSPGWNISRNWNFFQSGLPGWNSALYVGWNSTEIRPCPQPVCMLIDMYICKYKYVYKYSILTSFSFFNSKRKKRSWARWSSSGQKIATGICYIHTYIRLKTWTYWGNKSLLKFQPSMAAIIC